MAKSAIRRHHTQRILNNWNRELKHFEFMNHETLSFGRVQSSDPFDCGRPNCGICSRHKKYKEPRIRVKISDYLDDL
jgi:hypothetical protein